MPLSFESIHSAVRIIGDDQPALETALRKRAVIGSGFIVNVRTAQGGYYPYLVTAAHVIENQSEIQVQAAIPRPTGGMFSSVVIDNWRRPLPNVDLAIALFPHFHDIEVFSGIGETDIVPSAGVGGPFLMLGDQVYYVGILTPLDRPMVRSGTIGALDQEQLGLEGYDYVAHLIDCRSYGGFSGSPVFVSTSVPVLEVSGSFAGKPIGGLAYISHLAGMFTEHLTEKSEWASSRYGVGVMVRGAEIREALMCDSTRQEREDMDKEIRKAEKATSPRSTEARGKDVPSEFERFQDLAGRIVQVPKAEIDEQRQSE
jgi:hypothetical protein